jgi:hypothetical protein
LADRDDIIAHHVAGTLPELFVERMHRHGSDEIGKAFRATLMNLHNDGTIDALEPARTIGASIDQHQFFTVMHVYCDLIARGRGAGDARGGEDAGRARRRRLGVRHTRRRLSDMGRARRARPGDARGDRSRRP